MPAGARHRSDRNAGSHFLRFGPLVRSVPMCPGRRMTARETGSSTGRVCFDVTYQGKEVVHTMHDQHGTLEVRGR